MRWSIVGLVVIGLIAALSAAILAAAVLRGRAAPDPVAQADPEANIVLAAKPLKAMTVVKANEVIVKTVPAAEAPEKGLSNPIQVIGKPLAIGMEEGQVFTYACFATEGSGLHLASLLAEGKRAVSVSLSDYSALAGLLYPGSVVDVLVSIKLPVPDAQSMVVSTTLLEGIRVLAVGDHTIFSEGTSVPESDDLRRRKRLIVTLLVDPEQAQKLQLADQHGSISLALRNPTDGKPLNVIVTQLASLMARRPPEAIEKPSPRPAATQASPTTPGVEKPEAAGAIVIVRGVVTETVTFPAPE